MAMCGCGIINRTYVRPYIFIATAVLNVDRGVFYSSAVVLASRIASYCFPTVIMNMFVV